MRAAHFLVLAVGLMSTVAWAQPAAKSTSRAQREMQIFKVTDLGLEVWVENQPTWETQQTSATGRPIFAAESPVGYHPATVMTYASWPKEKVHDNLLYETAVGAIRRASQNFGVSENHSRAIFPTAATYGSLTGFEGNFAGVAQGTTMDVKIFVGQASGKFPVVMTIYTQEGKMVHLNEQIRRAWGKVKYLAP